MIHMAAINRLSCIRGISYEGLWGVHYFLEVQGSYNCTSNSNMSGQLYARGLEVVYDSSYGLVVNTLDLQVIINTFEPVTINTPYARKPIYWGYMSDYKGGGVCC